MRAYLQRRLFPLAWAASVCAMLFGSTLARAQVTTDHLRAILPDGKDLPGFVATRPAGELPPLPGVDRPAQRLEDWIRVDWDVSKKSGGARTGTVAVIKRTLYSSDGTLVLRLFATVADTVENARAEYRETWDSGIPDPGSLLGPEPIGDESVAMVVPEGGVVTCRLGRTVVTVDGGISAVAARSHVGGAFPVAAVQAVAHSILARAASQGASNGGAGSGAMAVSVGNGADAKGLQSGTRVYVPVIATARSAGWQESWDAKAGSLVLRRVGRATVQLKVLSAEAKIGATGRSALSVPPFLLHGQPTMDLAELVGMLGGKVVSKTADRVSVRI